MARETNARESFLERIRVQLKESGSTNAHVLPSIRRHERHDTDLAERFMAAANAVGARCEIVAAGVLNEKLRQLVDELGFKLVASSDSTLVASALDDCHSLFDLVVPTDGRDALFDAEAGITEAQWGIAETGTLVLESGAERNRLASLVPPIHIALLPHSHILGAMSDVLSRISTTRNQAVTFVTGPSRTADIELTLVVGVHGPRELRILIVSDR